MALRVFTIPIHGSEAAQEELNAFLRGHRIIAIDKRWVEQGTASFWCFCVEYLDPAVTPSTARRAGQSTSPRQRVDYREILDPTEFARYARLREWRKTSAEREAVPVYTLFTNEQLAQMVQQRVTTKTALEQVPGVGASKVEKYGDALLTILTANGTPADEANRSAA
jgi:superfamily II DNA helicase RecQ